jgi:GalNAc-alpha-(1->4)-GalNAc-alpha-(1->3)-diNAcBac-PP-undecaprenol alpha-1,4-N-acetyl-D-galactosaminyltransferase
MKKNKKILITIASLFGGGAERVVSVWASQLAEIYDVSVLLYGRSEKEYPISDKVKIYTVASKYNEYKKFSYFKRFSRMRRIIKDISPDIMINFLPRMQIWAMMASFGMKIFRIETVRNNPWELCRSSRIEHWLWMMCYKRANAVILQTQEQGEYFSKKIRRKCIVIPNPIDKQYVDSNKNYSGEKIKKFVAAGRLTPQKNYPLMVRAFASAYKRNSGITLSIYGSEDDDKTEYTNYLNSLIRELRMEGIIRLMGRTKQMRQVLLENDAFIMSSNFEGMPNSLIEAMAVGLICISTNCKTGPKDLIDDKINGFLVEVGNEDAFADAICQVADLEPDQIENISKAARQKILSLCSDENSINRLIDMISRL